MRTILGLALAAALASVASPVAAGEPVRGKDKELFSKDSVRADKDAPGWDLAAPLRPTKDVVAPAKAQPRRLPDAGKAKEPVTGF